MIESNVYLAHIIHRRIDESRDRHFPRKNLLLPFRMKRSARNIPPSVILTVVGSAFAARKQATQVGAPKTRVENESDEVEDQENSTLDELSDEDIRFRFSNAFDVLKGSVASAPPPAKKLRQKASLPQLVLDYCGYL